MTGLTWCPDHAHRVTGTHRVAHGHIHMATNKKIKHKNHVSEYEIVFSLPIFHLNRHIILYMSLNVVV
jgi:hypothetical protein